MVALAKHAGFVWGKFHQLVRNQFESPSLLDSEKLDYSSFIIVM
jgi:hypothetical protein